MALAVIEQVLGRWSDRRKIDERRRDGAERPFSQLSQRKVNNTVVDSARPWLHVV